MNVLLTIAIVVLVIRLLIKAFPTILRFLFWCVAVLLFFDLFVFLIPGPIDETLLFLALIVLGIRSFRSSKSSSNWSGSSGSYVLNKKSGVIHDAWDPSVETIAEKHRRSITYSEALDLVERGTKYRFKE
jgi:chromate transport protein ChrA